MFSWFKKKIENKIPIALENYDYTNNLCDGNNVTKWVTEDFCTTCLSELSHGEWTTKICLTCGTESERLSPTGVYRKIYLDGKWVQHLRIKGVDYLDKIKVKGE